MSKYFKSNSLSSSLGKSEEPLKSSAPQARQLVDGYTQSDLFLFNELASAHKTRAATSRGQTRSQASVLQTQYTERDHAQFEQLTPDNGIHSNASIEHPIDLASNASSAMTTEFGNPFATDNRPASSSGDKVSIKQFGDR